MHYVCSDIHGRYNTFKKMLEKIGLSSNDTLFILGDVIDRGPFSATALLDIMTDPRIILLIGNHEHMMIEALMYRHDVRTWLHNGADATLMQARDESIELRELCAILQESAYIVYPDLEVNGRHYYLTHAMPLLQYTDKPVLYKDTDIMTKDLTVWGRYYASWDGMRQMAGSAAELYAQYPKTTLIIGHTPTVHCWYGKQTSSGHMRISGCCGHVIDIDCGCASGNTLGCMRLEDRKEFYVPVVKQDKILQSY